MLFCVEWLCYRAGRYGEGWIWLLPFLSPLVLPPLLVLIFRPWREDLHVVTFSLLLAVPILLGVIATEAPLVSLFLALMLLGLILYRWFKEPYAVQWSQFVIRPVLIGAVALATLALHNLHLVNLPGVSPFVTGCLDSVRDCVTEKDIQTLRDLVAEKRRERKLEEGPNAIPLNELPPSIRKSSWGDPRPGEVSFHRQDAGTSIEICWGGTLPGYFGLLIDPEKPPKEKRDQSDEESFSWHHKFADGVYFFHFGG